MLLLAVLAVVGCYEEKEGCLDATALNFDVSADKDCCCEYPKLILKVNYKKNDTTSFSKLEYLGDAGHVYKVESFAFFLSHVEVKGQSGAWVDVDDSTEYWIFDAQDAPEKGIVSNNVVLVEDNVLKYDFGDFADFGSYDSVRFDIGMDGLQESVIPDSLSKEHALGVGKDSMWVSPKVYLQQKWVIVTDTSAANYKVDTFFVQGANVPLNLAYGSGHLVPKGKNYELKIDVNILKWLEGVSWQADKAIILDKLYHNSANAVSLVQ